MTDDEVIQAVRALVAAGEYLDQLTPSSPAAVQEAENLVGHRLPVLLRRLYLEVGNGGFGPGYGILGVGGGHGDDYQHTAVDLYRRARSGAGSAWGSIPVGLFPVCYWGCAIYSFVECADTQARMWGWDPNSAPDDIGRALFAQSITFGEWLARWVEGRLYQPALVQDPDTGQWRGATDEEYAEWMAES